MKNYIYILLTAILIFNSQISIAAEPNKITVDIYEGKTATVNSYIFSNGKSLTVMDVQRSTDEAKELARIIKEKGLPLTHILISHGHPDHYIGMSWLLKEFPKANIVVASSKIKEDIISFSTWMEKVGWLNAEPLLKPKSENTPEGFDYTKNINVLYSNELKMVGGGKLLLDTNYSPAEAEHVTTVFVEELNAFFSSDLGYNKVHLWMGQGVTKDHIKNWKAQLRKIKNKYSSKNPIIYPGHGKPANVTLFDTLIQYINDFTYITSKTSSKKEAMDKMKALYPDYEEANFLLKYSIDNHIKVN